MVQPTSLLPFLHQHHCYTSYGAPPPFTQNPIISLKPLSSMAQEPSHPSHQEKQGKEQKRDENVAGSSSSSSNNNHESKSWLQLGIGAPSISAQEQSERQKVTELQLFTNPVSVAGPETPGPATHIAPIVQLPALEQPTRPFPFLSSGSIRPSAEAGPSSSAREAGPSTASPTARVVILPPRPQSGLWFVLQASRNQRREPWLPQISRSFIRIRDGRMTISMVMKYLVNRLGLEHESQVEIACKAQRLHPAMTLEHVRDNIWSSREAGPSLPSPSSTVTDHLMTLEYGRSA
ncbi:hypothetical protein LUZ62_046199 [Rhynchospora pubera]|uniref:Uncharacterized protein n=1 Tax=Rhynchospora pubera TaxID=906938 RepID=A0AAV8FNY9_9POAL|nr:hypothetical protein LUZ62_046199 [Rhynchospora pubera]